MEGGGLPYNDLQWLFRVGMKREVPAVAWPLQGMEILELGGGRNPIPGATNLDWPEWEAEAYSIPRPDGSIGGIYAFHFLEHLHHPVRMLRECQRVLAPGAPLTLVVPHAQCTLALQDLDHKASFVLDTWGNLLRNGYYDKGRDGWRFFIHLNITMAVTERNTAIITQLIKE